MKAHRMTERETIGFCIALDTRCEVNQALDLATKVIVNEDGHIDADIRCLLCNGIVVMDSLGYPTCSHCGMSASLASRDGVECAFIRNEKGGRRTINNNQLCETVVLLGIASGQISKEDGHAMLIRWAEEERKKRGRDE